MLASYTRRIDLVEEAHTAGSPDEVPEGICYDWERAQSDGLFETITFDPDELFVTILETDVSVNIPPYTPVTVALERDPDLLAGLNITYAYHYGSNPVPEVHHDGFGHTTVA